MRYRPVAAVVIAGVVIGAGLTAVAPAQAAVACRVDYAVTSQWSGGFVANVTLNNLGDALNGWSLTWSFAGGQSVASGWNAKFSQSGSQVTVTNESYNGPVASGAAVSFGFQGTSSGTSNPAPTGFAINGVACTGNSGGGTTSTTTTRAAGTTTTTTTRAQQTTTTSSTTSSTTSQNNGSCGSGSFNTEAVQSGGTWTARRGGTQLYSGGDMLAAMQAAVNGLTSGRSSMQRVLVRGTGNVSAGSRLVLASYTSLEVCGAINVTGSGTGDMAPIYARGVHDIEVTRATITGGPNYGIFIRSVDNVHLGQIEMRLSRGLGVRIDNYGNTSVRNRNTKIDNVFVSGASSHAVETYGIDGVTIGTVTARNVGESGLLLNQTTNVTVGTVDADGAGAGTGYAAFRMANRNGRVGSSYATNIRVGTVKARGGGRGIFCVSESGGAVIDRVDIANTGNNSILIENCYNVTIAGVSGTVTGGGEIRIAARTDFANNSDITFQNLTVNGTTVRESPCGTNTTVRNNRLINAPLNICSGSNKGGNTTG